MSEQGAGADSTVVDEASGPAMAGDTSENCTSTSAVDVAHDAGLEDAPDSFDALDDEGASEDEDTLDDEGASEDKDTEDAGTSRRAALARGAHEKLASLGMPEKLSSLGGTAKHAYSGTRTFFANHETTAVLTGMALAFLFVIIIFAIVYSFVIRGATISRDNLPEYLANQPTPVENHELPHLSLHVLDITTDSYPTVRARLDRVIASLQELDRDRRDARMQIIARVERGEISAEQAAEQLAFI